MFSFSFFVQCPVLSLYLTCPVYLTTLKQQQYGMWFWNNSQVLLFSRNNDKMVIFEMLRKSAFEPLGNFASTTEALIKIQISL